MAACGEETEERRAVSQQSKCQHKQEMKNITEGTHKVHANSKLAIHEFFSRKSLNLNPQSSSVLDSNLVSHMTSPPQRIHPVITCPDWKGH